MTSVVRTPILGQCVQAKQTIVISADGPASRISAVPRARVVPVIVSVRFERSGLRDDVLHFRTGNHKYVRNEVEATAGIGQRQQVSERCR